MKVSKQHASVKKTLATKRRSSRRSEGKSSHSLSPKPLSSFMSTISFFARGPFSELLGDNCRNAEGILKNNIAEIAKAYGDLEEKGLQRRQDKGGEAVVMEWKFCDEFLNSQASTYLKGIYK